MPGMNQATECPRAIIRYSAERTRLLGSIHHGTVVGRTKVSMADIRMFSEADIGDMRPTGELLGRWLIRDDETLLATIMEDFHPDAVKDESIADPLPVLVVNFAVAGNERRYVIELIEWEGAMERLICPVESGTTGEVLGKPEREPARIAVARGVWDLCLPEGWRPRGSS